MANLPPIPQEWIKDYVDQMLKAAAMFPEGSPMRDAILLRADHAMSLVKAFREHKEQTK